MRKTGGTDALRVDAASGATTISGATQCASTLGVTGTAAFTGDVSIGGDLLVSGSTVTVNSAETHIRDRDLCIADAGDARIFAELRAMPRAHVDAMRAAGQDAYLRVFDTAGGQFRSIVDGTLAVLAARARGAARGAHIDAALLAAGGGHGERVALARNACLQCAHARAR